MTLLKKMVLASALFCLGSVSAVMHEISSLEVAHTIALNDSFNYAGVEFKVLRLLSVLGVQLLELELLNSGLESVFLLPSECTGNIFYVSPSGKLYFLNSEAEFVPLAEKDVALAGAGAGAGARRDVGVDALSDAHFTHLEDLSQDHFVNYRVAPVVEASEDLGGGAFRMRHPDGSFTVYRPGSMPEIVFGKAVNL